MKPVSKRLFAFLVLLLFYDNVSSQIAINGYNPRRYRISEEGNAFSISYGSIFWVDGNNTPLPGYSSPLSFFHGAGDVFSIEKMNVSAGVAIGYERQFNPRFALRTTFSTAKLVTGIAGRFDLLVTDKSRITQFGVYSKYTLTKNPAHRVQFHWLAGPELVYARKHALIEEYMIDDSSTPQTYRQDVSIMEGAMVTGLNISLKLSSSFSLFSDGLVGLSLPGKGFKSSNSGLGLKYNW